MKFSMRTKTVLLVAMFCIIFAEMAFAASERFDFKQMKDVGAFRYVIYFDILIVMYCLHRIYHSMFKVYYFTLQAFLGELLVTGGIAIVVIALIPNYVGFSVASTSGYLYFSGILVLSLVLIAGSSKSKVTENKTPETK